MYTVYCHIFPNGKRYIGITKTSTEKRWRNGNAYKTCPLIDRAIQKYGWDNLLHEVLDTANEKADAEEKERFYISKFRTTEPEFGYNVLPGGDVATNAVTEEMRVKLGNGWRGKTRTEEEKRKISDGVKKKFERVESNGHFGMTASKETKAKMSKSQKEAWKSEKRRKEASDRLKIRMKEGGFRDKVLENLASQPKRKAGEWSMPDSAKEKLSKHFTGMWIGEKSPCSKPVLQYTKSGEFIKRWANASEAERAGIALRVNISKCCKGAPHVKSAGGFVWRFEAPGD